MKRNITALPIILTVMLTAFIAFAAGKEVKLNAAQKKELNTFFSNFSEVFVEPFTRESITDTALIEFCVAHNYRNNYDRFSKGGREYQVKIKASYIDETAVKYFGRKVMKHQSIEDDGIEYKDGWYYTTDASGEEYCFSQVVSLSDEGNNMFTATVNVFIAGSGWTGDVHGTEADWRKSSPEDVPKLAEVMKATLKKVTEKGKSRYILLEYVKVK